MFLMNDGIEILLDHKNRPRTLALPLRGGLSVR